MSKIIKYLKNIHINIDKFNDDPQSLEEFLKRAAKWSSKKYKRLKLLIPVFWKLLNDK